MSVASRLDREAMTTIQYSGKAEMTIVTISTILVSGVAFQRSEPPVRFTRGFRVSAGAESVVTFYPRSGG
ncbi:hypothetical protein GCM10023193_68750 [Planotetraspora kaengkrachanensis]